MKALLLTFALLVSVMLRAQIQQTIYTTGGNNSNAILEIDSIRFNAAGDEMQVVLQSGTTNIYALSAIDNVTFGATPNPSAHSCGADSVHNPDLSYGSMTDQEGNVYKTIVIGTQEWMAENLKTSIYLNGDSILNVTDSVQWSALTSEAWCYFNNQSQYDCPYGKLYNWFAVSDTRSICPEGWHVPDTADWNTLVNFLDPSINGDNGLPNNAGGLLKSTGSAYWLTPNFEANNQSGFSAISAAYRDTYGMYGILGEYASFWNSSEFDSAEAYFRYIYFSTGFISSNEKSPKDTGLSVRCVKD